jgi:hypothetical protein
MASAAKPCDPRVAVPEHAGQHAAEDEDHPRRDPDRLEVRLAPGARGKDADRDVEQTDAIALARTTPAELLAAAS